ncbi:DegT/DnrJ/EryC1/StrS aminotransferase family protein [Clostridium chromiireducens]|uniref:DegT/DnrJ/EryC1/StrS aminotransferase family protein n=1 Tax=Clostridium chromiireducens TaxID=225345 RepID=A0A964W0T4_9CLOT|nr:DegT/DnrJ/EryC1/StrS aminotransferase family protein [Clostridium chromiireducens]MVX62347.1 DegT/DnrJ/EryC1/StrS aminotransferase family protein [Clostridium chromiireducens]
MGRYLKPIGGEQWFDINLFDNKLDNLKNTKAVLLSGGQSAIAFILENINIKDDEYILSPSYLCPSILYNFKKTNIKYEFYKINKDLSIDFADIEEKVKKLKINTIFFIDYFGFYHNEETIKYLKELQKQNITLIEDAVQMLWFDRKKFIGNYIFNSYRKFLPIDGSIVLCNKIKKYSFQKDNYYESVNLARAKKTIFQNFNIGYEEEFLNLYEKAEEEYYKRNDIIGMDEESKKMLSKVDYKFILKKRKENYCYLYDRLIQNDKIRIIYNKELIDDSSVLGLPILIETRDEIRSKLREFNIYCPVHWNILKEDWSDKYADSKYVSSRIMTLPIDQRYDFEDMDKMISCINNLVGS